MVQGPANTRPKSAMSSPDKGPVPVRPNMSDVEIRSGAAGEPAFCCQAIMGLVSIVTALLGIVVDAFNDPTEITFSPILIETPILAVLVIIEWAGVAPTARRVDDEGVVMKHWSSTVATIAADEDGCAAVSGWPRPDEPSGEITLVLDQRSTLDPKADLRDGLSAVARQGSHLWVANDETTSLERLTLEAGDQARAHRSFDLTHLLELPGDRGEMDIEGLDVEGDTLWLLGSHSSARKQVKNNATPAEAQDSLATVEVSQRRQVLARLSTKDLLDPGGGRTGQHTPRRAGPRPGHGPGGSAGR